MALRRALLACAAAAFLAYSGAFGSGRAPAGPRLVYWLLAIGGGTVIGSVAIALFMRWPWADERPWRAGALRVAAIAGPIALLVWLLQSAVFGMPVDVAQLPGVLIPVLVVTTAMVLLTQVVDRRPAATHAVPAPAAPAGGDAPQIAAPPAPPARLLDRLPARLRGAALHAVEAEDHYLRLHTSRGSDLILLRLVDAMAELDGIEGAQVHRSWWVARAAVLGSSRTEGRVSLTLAGGLVAPVSRTYVKALREDGWL